MRIRRVIVGLLLLLCLVPGLAAGEVRGDLPLDVDPRVRLPQDERIYFIFVDRFANGDTSRDADVNPQDMRAWHGGDLQGVIDKLDYIKDLGFTAVWLTPIVRNAGNDYHGYGAIDFFDVDPRFGTLEQAKQLVDEAHKRSIKVYLDLVVNHTGPAHPLARERPEWFNPKKPCVNWLDQNEIETCWIFDLPDFDQHNPEVREYILEYSLFWIEQTGVDGFRLDTAKHVPLDFWPWYTAEIKKRYPDFWLLGEVWSSDSAYLARYQDAGIDAITDFGFQEAAAKVYGGLNHTRVMKNAIEANLRELRDPTNMGGFIDNHDMMRFATAAYGDAERLKLGLIHLFTHLSIPILYYGTEIGMPGGNDPHNRADFPWETYQQQHPDVRRLVETLNGLRQEHIALRRGAWEGLLAEQWQFAFARHAGPDKVIVVLNNAEEDRYTGSLTLTETLGIKDGTVLFDELSGRMVRVAGGSVTLDLGPRSAAIFTVRETRAGLYFLAAVAGTVILLGGTLLLGRKRSGNSI